MPTAPHLVKAFSRDPYGSDTKAKQWIVHLALGTSKNGMASLGAINSLCSFEADVNFVSEMLHVQWGHAKSIVFPGSTCTALNFKSSDQSAIYGL